MLKSNELRLGNYVTDEFYEGFKNVIEVKSINDKGINLEIVDDGHVPECSQQWIGPDKSIDIIKPIPLTEEWLVKFGFVENEVVKCLYEKTLGILTISVCIERSNILDIIISNTNITGATLDIKLYEYVHQLQNLFYALSGTELTLKQ